MAFSPYALAGIALVQAVTSIVQGEQQRKATKRNLDDQRNAERKAEARAMDEARRQDEELARLQPKSPNVGAMLAASRKSPLTQLGGGLGGVAQVQRPTLLGQ